MELFLDWSFNPPESVPSMRQIEPDQFETLRRLVAIPSAYSQKEPIGDEVVIQNAIWEMLQETGTLPSKQFLKDGKRFNIIAKKGAPIERAKYVVMVYVHTDTIKKKEAWHGVTDYKLVRAGEFLHGIGVYDMKAGVMMLIDLLQTVNVPEGITLVGAFCAGEERDSDGIEKLMEWPDIHRVNIVLSPEIGTLGNDVAGNMIEQDNPKDIIVARPGNVKSLLTITAGDSHAFNTSQPDANEALRTAHNHLFAEFAKRGASGLQRNHVDLGIERLRERHIQTLDDDEGEFESVATGAQSKLTARIVPPSTIEEVRRWQQQALSSLMHTESWPDFGLQAEFTQFGMSYNPYVIRTDAPAIQPVIGAVNQCYGGYRFSAGKAVADGCYGHKNMNALRGINDPSSYTQYSIGGPRPPDQPVPVSYVPWLDIGPLGQGAHKKTERVYEESLVQLIAFYRTYLTRHLPEFLASHS